MNSVCHAKRALMCSSFVTQVSVHYYDSKDDIRVSCKKGPDVFFFIVLEVDPFVPLISVHYYDSKDDISTCTYPLEKYHCYHGDGIIAAMKSKPLT